jgi:hypothetical protein
MSKKNKKAEKEGKTLLAGDSVGIQTNGTPVSGSSVCISIQGVAVDADSGRVRILVNGVPIQSLHEEETVSQHRKDES